VAAPPSGGAPVPTDTAYVTAPGIAPLSVRLVEAALASPGGWAASPAAADALSSLPGPAFDVAWTDEVGRDGGAGGPARSPPQRPRTPGSAAATAGHKPVLVAFVGGATHAEVAALRWLGSQQGGGGRPARRFLMAASAVCGGEDLVRGFCEHP